MLLTSATHAPSTEPSTGRPLVLVVDDTAAQRYSVVRALRAHGFDVVEAANGAEAIDVGRRTNLDAVVLDVHLPDIDGFELCRHLKQQSPTMLPVLHLSSVSISGDARIRGLDGGADGYLTHPFDANELRAAVGALVRIKRAEMARLAQAATTMLLQETLDALPEQVALLGPTGELLVVNRAWIAFGLANGAVRDSPLGANYLAVCDAASRQGSDESGVIAQGIREVLAGRREEFAAEYPCHSPTAERWFHMTARAVRQPGQVTAIVTHADHTADRLAARAEEQARDVADAAHRERSATESLFRALTEHSQELVAIVSTAGTCTYVSPSVEHLLGLRVDEMVGRTPLSFIHADDRAGFEAGFFEILGAGHRASRRMTIRVRHRDGRWRYMEGMAQNLVDEPAVQGVTINARDVTERVEAEDGRARSEARFRRFVETTLEGVVAMDPSGAITYANPRIEALVEVAPGSLIGRALFDFLPAEERALAEELFAIPAPTSARTVAMRLRSANGGVINVQAAINPLTDDQGGFTGTLAMISDMTERVRDAAAMAEALRTADLDRRLLQATLEALPAGVFLMDAAGATTHINAAAHRIWGGAPPIERSEDYRAYRAWWPDTGQLVAPHEWTIARALAEREAVPPQLMEIERFDGTRAFILNSAAPIFDAGGVLTGGVVISVDVTARQADARERERLVESLENERRHLTSILEHAPSFLAVMRGPDHVIERINPAYRTLIGDRDVIGRPIAEAIPETTMNGATPRLDAVRATGVPFVAREGAALLVRTRGGPVETRYMDVVHQRLDQPDGNHAILTHGVDVTDRVVATQQLVATTERLRDQFAKLPVPTYLWERRDEAFVLVDCNEAAATYLTCAREEALGRAALDLFPGIEAVVAEFHRSLADHVVIRRSVAAELDDARGPQSVDLTIGPQPPDRVLVHAVDTTERTQLEAQLRQAQKMDAVGRLAGGVAHDFNNLLTVIGAHSAFLLESLQSSDPQREDAEAIHKASIRAAGLTRQLLAFSRKQILKPVITDLNATVEDTRKMLARLLGEDIEIVMSLTQGLARVVADPTQLDQVIVNLAVNARDAMPSGGRLSLSTAMATVEDGGDRRALVLPGEYVELKVADTGVGMSAAVQARLFEPFFTTKGPGKGTGLGLATVYGIVKQSAGYITVDSTPGAGSTFRVLLPAVAVGEESVQLEEATRAASRGVETILLVEDEPAVREVARRVLRRQGYVVLEASNGEAALALSRQFAATIHLVLTDAVMPGIGGAEVVRQLQEQRPHLRALFMSGHTDDEIVRRGIVSAAVPFVQKPFTSSALASAVRAAIDVRPAPPAP